MYARSGLLLAAALLLSAFRGSVSGSQPTIFWSQSPHGNENELGSIGTARVDGSGANGRLINGARSPAGIAVAGGYVYWANYTTGTISRARIDGSHADGRFIRTSIYATIGVGVDDRHIYWTYAGFDLGVGWIGRANLDGSGVDRHFIKAGDSPNGVVAADGHIYWTHRDPQQAGFGWKFAYAIGRASLDGTKIEPRFIRVPTAIDGIAANSRYLFWSNIGEHVIGRATLAGGDVYQRCVNVQLMPLETVPEGLAADNEFVYWTNYPADTIGRANLDGSDVDGAFVHVRGVPEGIAIEESDDSGQEPPQTSCAKIASPLLLGPPGTVRGPYGAGWGEAAPAVISNGGAAASGTISSIHWTSWGGALAVGRGLNPTYTPHGGYYGRPVVIQLHASVVRSCTPHGRRVYTRFVAREQVRPGGPFGKWFAWAPHMCTGIFR